MRPIDQLVSIYFIVVILGIGIYMTFLQKKYFKTVDHLDREAKFSDWVGRIYIALAVISILIAIWY